MIHPEFCHCKCLIIVIVTNRYKILCILKDFTGYGAHMMNGAGAARISPDTNVPKQVRQPTL